MLNSNVKLLSIFYSNHLWFDFGWLSKCHPTYGDGTWITIFNCIDGKMHFCKKNVFLIIIKQNLHWSKTKQKCMVKIAAWQQCVTKKLSKCIFCSPEISPKCQVLRCVSETEVVLHVGLTTKCMDICCTLQTCIPLPPYLILTLAKNL